MNDNFILSTTCQERWKFEALTIYWSIEQHRNTSKVPRVLLERKVKLIFLVRSIRFIMTHIQYKNVIWALISYVGFPNWEIRVRAEINNKSQSQNHFSQTFINYLESIFPKVMNTTIVYETYFFRLRTPSINFDLILNCMKTTFANKT